MATSITKQLAGATSYKKIDTIIEGFSDIPSLVSSVRFFEKGARRNAYGEALALKGYLELINSLGENIGFGLTKTELRRYRDKLSWLDSFDDNKWKQMLSRCRNGETVHSIYKSDVRDPAHEIERNQYEQKLTVRCLNEFDKSGYVNIKKVANNLAFTPSTRFTTKEKSNIWSAIGQLLKHDFNAISAVDDEWGWFDGHKHPSLAAAYSTNVIRTASALGKVVKSVNETFVPSFIYTIQTAMPQQSELSMIDTMAIALASKKCLKLVWPDDGGYTKKLAKKQFNQAFI